ncbi:MAG: threonine/serine exporter family protein [Eubacteriales bacterium]|nr:threonine/serine exporter family protein [Eubacteriales bacterium]
MQDFLFALVGTIGFAILFEVRRKNIFFCGLSGAVGWVTFMFLTPYTGLFVSVFLAAAIIVILARLFARILRAPAPIFYIPGIFPIVPGAGIYNTAYAVVMNDFPAARSYGMLTLKTSCAIVLGIALVSLFPYTFKKNRRTE